MGNPRFPHEPPPSCWCTATGPWAPAGQSPAPPANGGSTLERLGALAQLGERRLCKPEVAGSIPARSTPPTKADFAGLHRKSALFSVRALYRAGSSRGLRV